ncbi:hypothetical protein [Winogradskyella ursingii]|uniref:hypothetical protein n=1 Tax=Winogradskyella ursingii TaxID=2686079 RepID=UPI0015C723EF|nr:hypothetical protein [Winogradskyella ursingii]
MAEIKIEKKKPIWPWILLALLILALIFFLMQGDDDVTDDINDDDVEMIDDDNTMDNNDTVMISDMAASKISAYNEYLSDNGEMGIDHEYSFAVLSKLIDATEALANSVDVNIDADLNEARTQTASIKEDPIETDHANKIMKAGNTVVRALRKIQSQKYPSLASSCTQLQNSIMEIEPGTETLNQKEDVKDFFEQAGELLTKMKNQ